MGIHPIARVEVGVDAIAAARAAETAGAHRIFLHAGARDGGITPSAGLIAGARQAVGIDLVVLVRPRGGDFLYADEELAAMRRDILVARDAGADGVAFGALRRDGSIDEEAVRALLEAAGPLHVTFSRAFDMTRDPVQGLETLVALGVPRVLTSGQMETVLAGLERIEALAHRAAGRIAVVPAGHLDRSTLRLVVERTGAAEVHVTPTEVVRSAMEHRNLRCHLGDREGEAEYEHARLSPRILGEMIAALGGPRG